MGGQSFPIIPVYVVATPASKSLGATAVLTLLIIKSIKTKGVFKLSLIPA